MGDEREISSRLLALLMADAAASPEAEICGLLFGDARRIASARACRNVVAESARRFEIDPAALIAAHRAAREGGPRVIGCYHSHPSGDATPSPRDAADAAPDGWIWLILGDREASAWRAVSNGALFGRFDPIVLRVADCASDSPPSQSDTVIRIPKARA